jgi:hypothetical protein
MKSINFNWTVSIKLHYRYLQNQHFIWIRHFWTGLKRMTSSDNIRLLVRGRGQDNDDRLCPTDEATFGPAAQEDVCLLSPTFVKVSLAFESGGIRQLDPAR